MTVCGPTRLPSISASSQRLQHPCRLDQRTDPSSLENGRIARVSDGRGFTINPGATLDEDLTDSEPSGLSDWDLIWQRLKLGVWLSDLVVNTYTDHIAKTFDEVRSGANFNDLGAGNHRIYAFNSFMYRQYTTYGYISVRKWTRTVNLFAMSVILIPIHLADHWVAAAIFPQLCRIAYYNSLDETMRSAAKILGAWYQFLAYEHFNKKGLPIDLTEWRTIAYLSGPYQDNTFDCGVATCLALAEFSRWRVMKDPEKPLFESIDGGRDQIKGELKALRLATE